MLQDEAQRPEVAAYDPTPSPVVDWKRGFVVALKAGAVIAIASSMPILSLLCCLWVPLGGALSVWFYTKDARTMRAVSVGAGARLGAMAGVIGFLVWVPAYGLILSLAHVDFRKMMVDAAAKASEINPSPQSQAWMQWAGTPEGLVTMIVLMLFMFFLAFVLFATIGGAIGTRLFNKGE